MVLATVSLTAILDQSLDWSGYIGADDGIIIVRCRHTKKRKIANFQTIVVQEMIIIVFFILFFLIIIRAARELWKV